jgi:hypothetical protein
MQYPAVLYAASLSQALPLVARWMRRGRHLPAPVRFVLGWCAVLLMTDVLSIVIAREQGDNLFLQYAAVPIESGLILWALSGWQSHGVFRLAYRLAIPVLAAATAAVLIISPPEQASEELVAPFHALVLLAASLHTLLDRALRANGAIAEEPWFWVGLGLSLYYASSVAIGPFSQALLSSNVDWVRRAYLARAWTDIFAFALITTGILCPLFRRASGGPSSLRDSRSR